MGVFSSLIRLYFCSRNKRKIFINYKIMKPKQFIQKNDRRSVRFSLQRLLMLMTAIVMTLVTFTACEELNNNDDENGNPEGGGVAGKRLKSYIVSTPDSEDVRSEYSYNSDGTLKRIDNYYNTSSKLLQYVIITNYPDGTVAKQEQHMEDYPMITVWNFTNDSNKKPIKREGSTLWDGVLTGTSTYDLTFQNGRKTRDVEKTFSSTGELIQEVQRVYNYDNKGKRTTTSVTFSNGKTRQDTRTYNSDGTLQKVSGSDNQIITFTWENGKPPHDFDDYAQF